MQRRAFLKTATLAIHVVTALILTIPGLRFLLAPLHKKSKVCDYLRIAPLSAALKDRPVRIQVMADRTDAFMHYPPGPIGSVWLQRLNEDETNPRVRCFQVICPHLGCGIDYSNQRDAYVCPCHASEFDITGRQQYGPSPRDMDELESRITEADDRGERWIEIKYQAFQTGISYKRTI